MDLQIKQKSLSWNYIYNAYEDSTLVSSVKINRTFFPWERKILVCDDCGNLILCIKQEDIADAFISNLPIFGMFNKNAVPYICYENDIEIGYFKRVPWAKNLDPSLIGEIYDEKYEVYVHTGNEYSIFKNSLQVGFIARNAWKNGDGDCYNSLFDSDVNVYLAVGLISLIDIIHSTNDSLISVSSWQYNLKPYGRKKDATWTPKC